MSKHLYWGIHHLQSPDGGEQWRSFTSKNLAWPIPADETGESNRITLDDEFEVSTWLANFIVKDGKAHFLYVARTEPERQHYVRFDVRAGEREIDHQPAFPGDQLGINGLDGFFAAKSRSTAGSSAPSLMSWRMKRRTAAWAGTCISSAFPPSLPNKGRSLRRRRSFQRELPAHWTKRNSRLLSRAKMASSY